MNPAPFRRAMLWLAIALSAASICAALHGCRGNPGAYAPPDQRSAHFESWELAPPFVEVRSWNAEEFFVKDISPNLEGKMRRTFERPELRFVLNSTERQEFMAELGVSPAAFARTGPFSISCHINGHLPGELPCNTPGGRCFRKPVPPPWLATNQYTQVVMEASKLYIADDGVKLGFVIYRAGFVE